MKLEFTTPVTIVTLKWAVRLEVTGSDGVTHSLPFPEPEVPEDEQGYIIVHQCEAIRETNEAILVEVHGYDDPIWVPKSQIGENSDVYADCTSGSLVITAWFAEKAGLD